MLFLLISKMSIIPKDDIVKHNRLVLLIGSAIYTLLGIGMYLKNIVIAKYIDYKWILGLVALDYIVFFVTNYIINGKILDLNYIAEKPKQQSNDDHNLLEQSLKDLIDKPPSPELKADELEDEISSSLKLIGRHLQENMEPENKIEIIEEDAKKEIEEYVDEEEELSVPIETYFKDEKETLRVENWDNEDEDFSHDEQVPDSEEDTTVTE